MMLVGEELVRCKVCYQHMIVPDTTPDEVINDLVERYHQCPIWDRGASWKRG